MRLFVGLWPPSEVTEVLQRLPRSRRPALRWVGEEQWHLTLRFLGEVAPDELPAVLGALEAVARAQGPCQLMLGPLTERLGRARAVLVVPVRGVDALAAAVIHATSGFGQPPEDRPFCGHLTLARSRGRQPVPAALAGQPVEASWAVHEVALVHSRLDSTGARYETIASVRLTG